MNNRRARNPLAAEKSPRNEFYGFDFTPPPAQPEKERWHYPESDWGLMAKFQTQKQIYEALYERERSQKQVEQEIKRLREQNLQIIENELKKRQDLINKEKDEQKLKDQEFAHFQEMVSNPGKYAHMNASTTKHHQTSSNFDDSALFADLHHKPQREKKPAATPVLKISPNKINMKESSLFNKFGKSSLNHDLLEKALNQTVPPPSSSSASATSLHQTKRQTKKNLDIYEKNLLNTYKTLTNVPVANIKTLQENYPEVLKQYRTDRAAEFIAKQGTAAIQPPPHRDDIGTTAFRPGGVLPAPKKAESTLKRTHGGGGGGGSTQDLSLPLDMLTQQLKKTEDDIAMQRLKIGLNTKPTKSYDKTSKHH